MLVASKKGVWMVFLEEAGFHPAPSAIEDLSLKGATSLHMPLHLQEQQCILFAADTHQATHSYCFSVQPGPLHAEPPGLLGPSPICSKA